MTVNRAGPDLRAVIREEIARTLRAQTFSVPTYASDPAAPNDGDMWLNSTSGELRVMLDGTVYTVMSGVGSGTVIDGGTFGS